MPEKPIAERDCIQCGTAFSDPHRVSGRHRRFCSAECKRQRQAEQRQAYNAEGRYAEQRRRYIGRYLRKFKEFECVVCRAKFRRQQTKADVCGPDCLLALRRCIATEYALAHPPKRKWPTDRDRWRAQSYVRRAVTRAVDAETFAEDEIFERDGWMCQLCNEGVDRSLVWPHPKSASIDHVIPVSRGGAHRRNNVQCAHLGCNSSAGAKLTKVAA